MAEAGATGSGVPASRAGEPMGAGRPTAMDECCCEEDAGGACGCAGRGIGRATTGGLSSAVSLTGG